jgi:hypothetical protein
MKRVHTQLMARTLRSVSGGALLVAMSSGASGAPASDGGAPNDGAAGMDAAVSCSPFATFSNVRDGTLATACGRTVSQFTTSTLTLSSMAGGALLNVSARPRSAT